jgi:hypothetical protein
MWCWYYGSPESPYNYKYKYEHEKKCKVITKLCFEKIYSGKSYTESTISELRYGRVPSDFNHAIEFFRKIDTGARSEAMDMINSMYDSYKDIIEKGLEGFKKDGETDYQKFTSTMKLIRSELDELIKIKENGYGVSESAGEKEDDELTIGSYWIREYLESKK